MSPAPAGDILFTQCCYFFSKMMCPILLERGLFHTLIPKKYACPCVPSLSVVTLGQQPGLLQEFWCFYAIQYMIWKLLWSTTILYKKMKIKCDVPKISLFIASPPTVLKLSCHAMHNWKGIIRLLLWVVWKRIFYISDFFQEILTPPKNVNVKTFFFVYL